jgi:hypothetical protein
VLLLIIALEKSETTLREEGQRLSNRVATVEQGTLSYQLLTVELDLERSMQGFWDEEERTLQADVRQLTNGLRRRNVADCRVEGERER